MGASDNPLGMLGGALGGVGTGGSPGQSRVGGKNAMPAEDYIAANAKQTKANRPDQTNAYGTTSKWHQNPDGSWSQESSFGGALGQTNTQLQGQLADATKGALDFSGAPALQYGEDAFKKASDAAYGQLTSRLDPMWSQRQDAERTRLINQGLDPTSEAFRASMDDFGRQRNDAYQGALNSSIGLGQSAAQQMFDQSATARSMSIADMLRKREQPLKELQGLNAFTGQSNFSADQGLQAAGMQGEADWRKYNQKQKEQNEMVKGLFDLAGSIIPGVGGIQSLLKLLRIGGNGGGEGGGDSGRYGAGEYG